jgi:fructose-1,6-bisphosphatase/inositol monophosphatase family enzyme
VIEGALGAMLDPALNPWDLVPTRALVEAAGGVAIVLPSRSSGKFDALFGNRALVARLDSKLGFSGR